MSRSAARAGILLVGFLGAVFHGTVTLLFTLGLSLGRQRDDPWHPFAELLMATAFYGTIPLLALLLWLDTPCDLECFEPMPRTGR